MVSVIFGAPGGRVSTNIIFSSSSSAAPVIKHGELSLPKERDENEATDGRTEDGRETIAVLLPINSGVLYIIARQ